MRPGDGFWTGIARENPVAVLLLGLCPAAAVCVRVIDALWMSAGVFSVLLLSSFCMFLVATQGRGAQEEARPAGGRLWGVLLLSSALTACFEVLMLAVAPDEGATLGIYVPLISVNCLVLGRIDASSRSAPLARSIREALGSGLGFFACLLLISLVREVLAAGTITLFPVGRFSGTIVIASLVDDPARALGFAGGGLLCLGYLAGIARALRSRAPGRETGKEGAP